MLLSVYTRYVYFFYASLSRLLLHIFNMIDDISNWLINLNTKNIY